MITDLAQLLRNHGPGLTGDILPLLESAGLTRDTARQRLSRRSKSVQTLSGLSFPKNARFYYHVDHFGRDLYWRALHRAVTEGSPAYGPALAAMAANGGVMPAAFFPIASGAPVKQKGHTGSDAVLSRLESAGLLQQRILGDMPVVVLRDGLYDVDEAGLPARLTVLRVLLDAVADWARKLGMVSYNKVSIRHRDEPLPLFGTHAFDLIGPSYLAPMIRYKDSKPKPGAVVCDAYIGDLDLLAANGFIRKCTTSRALRRLPPFLPVLIADGFTPDAFNALRAQGIIATKPSALFGRDVARGLAGLLETLRHASAIAVSNPGVIETLFSQLGHIEGAASNLRGALFELIVGHVVHREGAQSIDVGRRVRLTEKESVEIDVFSYAASEVRVIECKGYAPTHRVDAEEVGAWIRDKAPRIHKHFRVQDNYQHRTFRFEFWTSGDFTPEARVLAAEVAASTRKYDVQLVGGQEVRARIGKVNASGLGKVFDEHYAKHPLAKAERKFGRADVFEQHFTHADFHDDI